MTAIANSFIPDWDNKTARSLQQMEHEEDVRLHLMPLAINANQRESLRNAFVDAVRSDSDLDLSEKRFNFLTNEQKLAVMIKSKGALFAAAKFYPDLPFNNESLLSKAKEIFGGLLLFEEK